MKSKIDFKNKLMIFIIKNAKITQFGVLESAKSTKKELLENEFLHLEIFNKLIQKQISNLDKIINSQEYREKIIKERIELKEIYNLYLEKDNSIDKKMKFLEKKVKFEMNNNIKITF